MKSLFLLVALTFSIEVFPQNRALFSNSHFTTSTTTVYALPDMANEYLSDTRLRVEQLFNKRNNDQTKEKPWNISLFLGFSMMGPGKDIKDQMALQFGDTQPAFDGWIFGHIPASSHPTQKSYPIWNMEIEYRFTRKSSLCLNYGQLNNTLTEGHDHEYSLYAWEGNNLSLRSDLDAISLLYVYHLDPIYNEISIGPVLGIYKIEDSGMENSEDKPKEFKPGVQLGYALSMVHGHSFFLKLKANYTWLPDATIGPYSVHTIWTSGLDQTSVFEETKVSLSTLGIGLSAGWRL